MLGRLPGPAPKGMFSRNAAGPDPGFEAPRSDEEPIRRAADYVENVQSAERGELVPYCRCSDLIGCCDEGNRAACNFTEERRGRGFYGLVPR